VTNEGRHESNASNFFLIKSNFNNNEIYMDDSYIFCNYDTVFPQSLRRFQQTLANAGNWKRSSFPAGKATRRGSTFISTTPYVYAALTTRDKSAFMFRHEPRFYLILLLLQANMD
jgi:hypothetical protein